MITVADAQVHIWAASTPQRPWPARQAPHRAIPFSQEDLVREMDAAGVARAVIVPPSWEGDRNDLALAAAINYPDRLGVMGVLDINNPRARDQIASWRQQRGMFGLRCTFVRQPLLGALLEGQVDWLWKAAQSARVPIMLAMSSLHLHRLGNIAEQYPDLKLAIDHFGVDGFREGKRDAEAFAHLDVLVSLARWPNIAVKASSLPAFTNERVYPYLRLHPYIRRVYDAFGPRRMFWGSDLTNQPCSYRQAVTMFTEGIPWLTAEDKEWIMGRALCEWLEWDMT